MLHRLQKLFLSYRNTLQKYKNKSLMSLEHITLLKRIQKMSYQFYNFFIILIIYKTIIFVKNLVQTPLYILWPLNVINFMKLFVYKTSPCSIWQLAEITCLQTNVYAQLFACLRQTSRIDSGLQHSQNTFPTINYSAKIRFVKLLDKQLLNLSSSKHVKRSTRSLFDAQDVVIP